MMLLMMMIWRFTPISILCKSYLDDKEVMCNEAPI